MARAPSDAAAWGNLGVSASVRATSPPPRAPTSALSPSRRRDPQIVRESRCALVAQGDLPAARAAFAARRTARARARRRRAGRSPPSMRRSVVDLHEHGRGPSAGSRLLAARASGRRGARRGPRHHECPRYRTLPPRLTIRSNSGLRAGWTDRRDCLTSDHLGAAPVGLHLLERHRLAQGKRRLDVDRGPVAVLGGRVGVRRATDPRDAEHAPSRRPSGRRAPGRRAAWRAGGCAPGSCARRPSACCRRAAGRSRNTFRAPI